MNTVVKLNYMWDAVTWKERKRGKIEKMRLRSIKTVTEWYNHSILIAPALISILCGTTTNIFR